VSGEPGARAVDRESSLRAMLAELGEKYFGADVSQ